MKGMRSIKEREDIIIHSIDKGWQQLIMEDFKIVGINYDTLKDGIKKNMFRNDDEGYGTKKSRKNRK